MSIGDHAIKEFRGLNMNIEDLYPDLKEMPRLNYAVGTLVDLVKINDYFPRPDPHVVIGFDEYGNIYLVKAETWDDAMRKIDEFNKKYEQSGQKTQCTLVTAGGNMLDGEKAGIFICGVSLSQLQI
jgi:hypothetical protein